MTTENYKHSSSKLLESNRNTHFDSRQIHNLSYILNVISITTMSIHSSVNDMVYHGCIRV